MSCVALDRQCRVKAMGEKLPAHHLIAVEGKAGLQGDPRGLVALCLAQGLEASRRKHLRLIQR